MDKLMETKTVITAFFISIVGWLISKLYNFFDIKIKRIDSIEELKKDFDNFKVEQKEDILELKSKIDNIHDKLMK